MQCPRCKADNRAGRRFCGDCGLSLKPSLIVSIFLCMSTGPGSPNAIDRKHANIKGGQS